MTGQPLVKFLRLNPTDDADIPLPCYMTPQAAGMDIYAAVKHPVMIQSDEIKMIPTGFAVAIPEGFEAQIRPRSGLAVKHGISIINSPGTIDSDYRGEVMIALINLSAEPFRINRKERIAQMVFQQVCRVRLEIVEQLDETVRDTGGFGHTGR